MILYIIIGVLAFVIIVLLIKLIMIKKDINSIKRELINNRNEEYNTIVRVSLSDKSVEAMTAEINNNLEYQKELKLKEERSNAQLKESISDIAHDLRTPLTVIKGNLQMLESETLSDKGREYLDISAKKAETLKDMVDQFFELSVLESDNAPVVTERIDVISFLSEVIVDNETLIRNAGLEPEITFPNKSIYIKANKELLSRVFSNLISNIIKYAKDNFILVVSENAGKCNIRIGNQIKDTDSIDIEHIFDRTYRADKARSDGSAGLGLYIAKLLIEKQHGSICACITDNHLYFDLEF